MNDPETSQCLAEVLLYQPVSVVSLMRICQGYTNNGNAPSILQQRGFLDENRQSIKGVKYTLSEKGMEFLRLGDIS